MINDGHRDNCVGERKHMWEESRMVASSDNGLVTNSVFGAEGERTVRCSGEGRAHGANRKQ